MNSVGSHGSSSLPFVMKVMVCHFVSDSHEVMTALIVVLPSIVVVEISLQLHRSFNLMTNSRDISSTIYMAHRMHCCCLWPFFKLVPNQQRCVYLGYSISRWRDKSHDRLCTQGLYLSPQQRISDDCTGIIVLLFWSNSLVELLLYNGWGVVKLHGW
jgi:hypothetical protein